MQPLAKKILRIILVCLLFIGIAIFVFFNSRELIWGIKIKNVNLIDNLKISQNTLQVTGLAKNAVKLTLNDREISIDQAGNFNETTVLLPGYNVLRIKAQDKFGNSDEKNYQLIY